MEYERRDAAVAWPDLDFEVRSVDGGMEFTGYAAVFNTFSSDLGGFREQISPGAFTRSLNAAANGQWDVRSLLKLCPMPEEEVLLIFSRLLDRQVIELR